MGGQKQKAFYQQQGQHDKAKECHVQLNCVHPTATSSRSLARNKKAYGITGNKEEGSHFLGTIFSLV